MYFYRTTESSKDTCKDNDKKPKEKSDHISLNGIINDFPNYSWHFFFNELSGKNPIERKIYCFID
jgi:hypothetical protein